MSSKTNRVMGNLQMYKTGQISVPYPSLPQPCDGLPLLPVPSDSSLRVHLNAAAQDPLQFLGTYQTFHFSPVTLDGPILTLTAQRGRVGEGKRVVEYWHFLEMPERVLSIPSSRPLLLLVSSYRAWYFRIDTF